MDKETERYEYILDDPGVRGVSKEGDEVLVFVEQKKPPEAIPEGYLVSERIDSSPTTVIDAGDITAHESESESGMQADGNLIAQLRSPRERFRPVRPGVSEINASAGAATAGFMARVTDPSAADIGLNADEGDIVRVSNMHVYGRAENAEIGEPIVQPSPVDGDSDGAVGEYLGGVELADGSPADAAARSVRADERNARRAYMPHGVGPIAVDRSGAGKDDPVQKTGRTTGHTEGRVLATGASINVSYGDQHENVRRRDVIVTTAMSKGGDSGSPLLTREQAGVKPTLVGHIFSGSDRVSIADKLENIEDGLGVSALAKPPADEEPDEPDEGDGDEDDDGDEPDREPGEGGGERPEQPDDPSDPERPEAPENPSERPESEFIELVGSSFQTIYGTDRVLIEPALADSRREPDIVVKTNMGLWFIEVENDAEDVLKEGVGQAMMYAGHDPEGMAMVIYPDTLEIEEPELTHLKRRAPLPFRSFPSDFPAFKGTNLSMFYPSD
jgi:hypothetical protein